MRSFRSLVLGLLLVILSPLGWGEDVYYCVEESSASLVKNDSSDSYKVQKYKTSKFTFKYEADAERLAIKGKTYAGDDPYYVDCEVCNASGGYFNARSDTLAFYKLPKGRFFTASAYPLGASMTTGTCTKF